MDKKILLVGGSAAVMGFLYYRARTLAAAARAAAASSQDQANLMALGSMTPYSGGGSASYDGSAGYSTPATTDSTGTAPATQGGTTDPSMSMIAALLPMLQQNSANQHTENTQQIQNSYMLGSQAINAGLNASDSAALSALFQTGGGSGTINHNGTDTSINITKSLDPVTAGDQALVASEYTKVLGRAPDQAGLSYWTNAIQQGTYNMGNFDAAFKNAATPELSNKQQKATIQQAA